MSFENFDAVPEAVTDAAEEMKLSAFQNPSFTEMAEHDLMPKIRFTTDAQEAVEAARTDRSDPFHLPDSVFHVEPSGDTAGEKPAFTPSSFQNDSFGIDASKFTKDTAGAEGAGDYVGPTPDALNLKIENDVKDLTFAQEQLALAIERGTGVMQAMRNVESAQTVLDAHMKLYNEAIKFRTPDAPVAASSQITSPAETPAEATGTGEAKLGSASHAQWELERAYKSGNKTAIENAKRDLAHEKAKEEAKK